MTSLTSLKNPRIKALAKLRQSRQRRATGMFLVETRRTLGRALAADFEVIEVYGLPEALGSEAAVEAAARGAELVEINEAILEKLTYRNNPEGLVGVVSARTTELDELEAGGALLVCSGLEKPGNLGAILRTADAAGVGAVLLDESDVDLFNPQVIRASTGAVFAVPVVCRSGDDLVLWLDEAGYRIVAASPEGECDFTAADLSGRTAIVVGAEAEGLGDFWREVADEVVGVPMRGRVVDSLNVSVTAALLMFEAMRQGG